MNPDAELLRRYVESRSEPAFAELVQRHLNLVYFAALRRTNDVQLAEDIAQQVFVALAAQAATLSRHAALTGWLYTTTRFLAAKALRTERRRKARELEAQMMNELDRDANTGASCQWEAIRPVIDEALDALDERDREAVLMRCLQQRPFAEIGASLRLSEDAARMRVDRALGKLRDVLARRGVNSTNAALATALASQAGAMAPAGVAVSVTSAALQTAVVTAAGAGSLGAVLHFMNTAKVSVSIAAAGLIAVTGAVYQTSRARDAATALAEIRESDAAAAARIAALEKSVAAAEQDRAGRLAALERRRSENTAAKPAATAPVDDVNARYRDLMNELARNDEKRREALTVYNQGRVRETYRALLHELGFSEAEKERAIGILAKPSAGLETAPGPGIVAQALPEFRAAFGESAAARLAGFLEPEQFNAREAVRELSAKLYFADAPFTPPAIEELERLIRDSRLESLPPRLPSETPVNHWLRTRDWPRIQAEAAKFLLPAQQNGLRAFAAAQRNNELLAAAAHENRSSNP